MTRADEIDNYLKARLALIRQGESITRFDGQPYTFQTDAGQQVDKNLEYTEHPDELPSCVIYTGKNSIVEDDTVELGMENHLLEFSVEGFILCDKAGTEGEYLRTDIAATLRADPWWGGLIIAMQSVGTDIAVQSGDEVYAVVKFSGQALYSVPFGSE